MPKQNSLLFLTFTTLLAVALIAGTLAAWGQPWICTCGYVTLWSGNIFSSGNSQHIADWYTFSHILHGILIGLIGTWLFPKLSFVWLLCIGAATGVAWEIIEHTDWVLNRFRFATINQGYRGDSVLNAICDYLFMTAGFLFAYSMRKVVVLATVVFLEMTAGLLGRDNLALTTVMLVYPIESIKTWQEEIKPKESIQKIPKQPSN
jgi:hypothetical protein